MALQEWMVLTVQLAPTGVSVPQAPMDHSALRVQTVPMVPQEMTG